MLLKVVPVIDSPLSVTAVTPTCNEAGMLDTLTILQGKYAENFLQKTTGNIGLSVEPS